MEKNIKDILLSAKREAETDFLAFFIKNIAIYVQLKNNYEFEIPKRREALKWVIYERSCLGIRYGEKPSPPNDGACTSETEAMYYGKPNQFDLINIFSIVDTHKGLVADLGFEVYYLTEVQKLHDEVFRLKMDLQEVETEITQEHKAIDYFHHEQDLKAERKRKEDFAKAERFKEKVQAVIAAGNFTQDAQVALKKSYSNLNWNGKEHFGRIAKEECAKLFSPLQETTV